MRVRSGTALDPLDLANQLMLPSLLPLTEDAEGISDSDALLLVW